VRTVAQLDAAAAEAAAAFAAARDAADKAHAEAEQRRQTRLDAYDRQQQADYDRRKLEQDVTDAENRLSAAIKADPVWAATIALGVAQRRLRHRWAEAGSVGQLPPSAEQIAFEFLARVADREANNQAEDELDARAQARAAAGEEPS